MTGGRRLPGAARSLVGAGAAVLLLAVVAAAVAAVVVPRVAGATPYTVLSGSMQPELSPGDLVVTRPVSIEDVRVGSVVTFQLRSGEPATVTHRVVGLSRSVGGEPLLVTQGDANEARDPRAVRAEQLRGEVWYALPALGHVAAWATPEQRALIARVAAGVLLAYAVLTLVGAYRRREVEAEAAWPGGSEPAPEGSRG